MLFGALFASYILIRTGPELAAGRHDPQRPARHVQHDRPDHVVDHDGHGLGVADAPPLRDVSALHGVDDPARVRLPRGQVLRIQRQVRDHLYPSTNNFLAIYFTLTGLHMLHVLGGMAVNAYFWGPGAKLWKTNPCGSPTGSRTQASSGISWTWSGSSSSRPCIFCRRQFMTSDHAAELPGITPRTSTNTSGSTSSSSSR